MAQAIHRSNRERTSATRTRLLDATLEVLVEVGYARASTVQICRRADAPRGTLLHHFPTRASLMRAAIGYLWERRWHELRQALAAIAAETPAGSAAAGPAVDRLWQLYSGPSYDAWTELVVAARTDAELCSELRHVWRRAGARVPPDAMQLVCSVLNGLALDRIFRGPEELAPIVETLKRLLVVDLVGVDVVAAEQVAQVVAVHAGGARGA